MLEKNHSDLKEKKLFNMSQYELYLFIFQFKENNVVGGLKPAL